MPTLVCLHGFLGGADDFDSLRAHLDDQLEVVTPDLPGHGQSPAAGNFADGVASCATAIRAVGVERCHLLGYSMGGRIALKLAIDNPDLIASITAVGAHPGIEDADERRARAQRDEDTAVRLQRDFESFLDDWYAQPLFAPLRESPAFVEMRARRRSCNPGQLARALIGLSTGGQPPLAAALSDNPVPTLLVTGEKDPKYRAIGASLAARAAHIEHRVVPGIGHAVHLEAPGELAALVTEHISRQPNY